MSANDFWDDCKYEPRIEDSELTYKYKFTYSILSKNKPSANSKSQKALNYCHKLYSKAKIKSVILNSAINKQTRNTYSKEDLIECTWKPKINESPFIDDKRLTRTNSQTIYQRGMTQLHNHMQAINVKKSEKENVISSNSTFMPLLMHKSSKWLSKVLGSNYRLDQSDSQNLFLYRYKKARRREEEKRRLIANDQSNNKKDFKKISRVSRSLSTKESHCMKQSLHEELFSIGLTQES